MDKRAFSERLSALRIQKGISARDMSLSLGQNAGKGFEEIGRFGASRRPLFCF